MSSINLHKIQNFDSPKLRVAKMMANLFRTMSAPKVDQKRSEILKKRLRRLYGQLGAEMDRQAANPIHLRNLFCSQIEIFIPWAADLKEVKAEFDRIESEGDHASHGAAVTRFGGLTLELVERKLVEWNLEPHYCFGLKGVRMKYACKLSFSETLCAMLYAEFSNEIRTGEIVVYHRLKGWMYPELTNPEVAEGYIAEEDRLSSNDSQSPE